jgi:hypothetical protein
MKPADCPVIHPLGGPEPGATPVPTRPEDQREIWSDDYDDNVVCDRCGGEGSIDYDDAGPAVWGEDCPSEMNHLVTCPDCLGQGVPLTAPLIPKRLRLWRRLTKRERRKYWVPTKALADPRQEDAP